MTQEVTAYPQHTAHFVGTLLSQSRNISYSPLPTDPSPSPPQVQLHVRSVLDQSRMSIYFPPSKPWFLNSGHIGRVSAFHSHPAGAVQVDSPKDGTVFSKDIFKFHLL